MYRIPCCLLLLSICLPSSLSFDLLFHTFDYLANTYRSQIPKFVAQMEDMNCSSESETLFQLFDEKTIAVP
jgi:hypothetical protein